MRDFFSKLLVKVFNGEFPGAAGGLDLQVVISGAGEFG
jgi:hypothetical protein